MEKIMSKTIVVWLLSAVYIRITWSEMRDFHLCHDDFSLTPVDGVLDELTYPWLGFAQYIHVTSGLPHLSRAPRVILVHRQFVIATAKDMVQVPKNYRIGHIIFGDYEQDEKECGLTQHGIKMNAKCPRAYIEVSVLDIIPHPEYSRFGVANSLCLLKLLQPLQSRYMIPVCLPTFHERVRKKKHKNVYLIDYLNSAPKDFDSERMAKKTLTLYTHKECKSYRDDGGPTIEGLTHALCTSGCGVRPGAPIISHAADGRFELMGLAAGGALCLHQNMRQDFNDQPPLYIDVYPYVNWIVNVITAHDIPMPYSHQFRLVGGGSHVHTRSSNEDSQKSGWKARTFLKGNYCFKKSRRKKAAFFYLEKFEVRTQHESRVKIEMKISAGIECTIVCARMLLPNSLVKPNIEGIGTYNITIKFDTDWFPQSFYFSLGLSGTNSTYDKFKLWLPDRTAGYWIK